MPVAALPVRALRFESRSDALDPTLEWLVTNGLGGYASGVVGGGLTRRYHGLLVSAHPPPLGRIVSVSAIRTSLVIGQRRVAIDHERRAELDRDEAGVLREFRLEGGLPVWRYEADGCILVKRVVMPHRRNTTVVSFALESRPDLDAPVTIACDFAVSPRPLEERTGAGAGAPDAVHLDGGEALLEFGDRAPRVRIRAAPDPAWRLLPGVQSGLEYDEERLRGYESHGVLWMPLRVTLALEAAPVEIIISTEEPQAEEHSAAEAWEAERARRLALLASAPDVGSDFEAELVLAADQFLIEPVGHERGVRHRGPGAEAGAEEPRATASVIAGYHWFTDWGRDTMISLDGLALATGRFAEARHILELFAGHVRDGLIPNLFPEGQRVGLYHTADATLWLFEALARYEAATGDREFVRHLLPTLEDIVEWHLRGTSFGIGVDPFDGLLRQGADGYALTWMDAKVDGWVVTPRRGKAVEINALWYNALSHVARWLSEAGEPGREHRCRDAAERARQSFNTRFWNPRTGHLFDLVEGEHGDDPACRPNQLFAISLPNPVLDRSRWPAVLQAVEEKLVTPAGLRTLAPGEPAYRSQYVGALRDRDAAYHQGTVWPWLIGAYIDARLKVAPHDRARAREALRAFPDMLSTAGIGSLSEICDADTPHLPRGCIAQAWSVAEVLRAWKITA
jgi:predicted glycogen debranching enzyme